MDESTAVGSGSAGITGKEIKFQPLCKAIITVLLSMATPDALGRGPPWPWMLVTLKIKGR
jgi:hypothetical protein